MSSLDWAGGLKVLEHPVSFRYAQTSREILKHSAGKNSPPGRFWKVSLAIKIRKLHCYVTVPSPKSNNIPLQNQIYFCFKVGVANR